MHDFERRQDGEIKYFRCRLCGSVKLDPEPNPLYNIACYKRQEQVELLRKSLEENV